MRQAVTVTEQRALELAQEGDEQAFADLVGPLRDELTAHCYRMLGSYTDAEDVVQETLTRAWQHLDGFTDRGAMIRPWLYKIATNRCLSRLARRSRRELPADPVADRSLVSAVAETRWLEPYPDHRLARADDHGPESSALARDSIRLAFVAALQHLPAQQRAVLLLREVLGFSAAETAGMLDTTVAAVNSALQRARRTRDERLVGAADSPADPSTGVSELAERYVSAWQGGDVDAIVAMLSEDVRYTMPPLEEVYVGLAAVRQFLLDGPLRSHWRFLPTRANGDLAFGTYRRDEDEGAFVPGGLDVIFVADGQIVEVVCFLTAEFTRFGLPSRIDEEVSR
jgi:RNA polymerase sigma-70 factor (TIGR02960 family)